jgi:hypothetical protein
MALDTLKNRFLGKGEDSEKKTSNPEPTVRANNELNDRPFHGNALSQGLSAAALGSTIAQNPAVAIQNRTLASPPPDPTIWLGGGFRSAYEERIRAQYFDNLTPESAGYSIAQERYQESLNLRNQQCEDELRKELELTNNQNGASSISAIKEFLSRQHTKARTEILEPRLKINENEIENFLTRIEEKPSPEAMQELLPSIKQSISHYTSSILAPINGLRAAHSSLCPYVGIGAAPVASGQSACGHDFTKEASLSNHMKLSSLALFLDEGVRDLNALVGKFSAHPELSQEAFGEVLNLNNASSSDLDGLQLALAFEGKPVNQDTPEQVGDISITQTLFQCFDEDTSWPSQIRDTELSVRDFLSKNCKVLSANYLSNLDERLSSTYRFQIDQKPIFNNEQLSASPPMGLPITKNTCLISQPNDLETQKSKHQRTLGEFPDFFQIRASGEESSSPCSRAEEHHKSLLRIASQAFQICRRTNGAGLIIENLQGEHSSP